MKELKIPIAVSATLLLVAAFFGGSAQYYQVLRIAVFLTCTFAAYLLRGKMLSPWFIGLAAIAVLYNPFQAFHFPAREWTVIDTVSGIFLLVSLKAAQ